MISAIRLGMISRDIPDDGDYNRRSEGQKRDYMTKVNSMRSKCGLPELPYKSDVRLEFYTGSESDVSSLSDKARRKLNKIYWSFFDKQDITASGELEKFQQAREAKIHEMIGEGKDAEFILEGEEDNYFILGGTVDIKV